MIRWKIKNNLIVKYLNGTLIYTSDPNDTTQIIQIKLQVKNISVNSQHFDQMRMEDDLHKIGMHECLCGKCFISPKCMGN